VAAVGPGGAAPPSAADAGCATASFDESAVDAIANAPTTLATRSLRRAKLGREGKETTERPESID
jgi:hypothetical protein